MGLEKFPNETHAFRQFITWNYVPVEGKKPTKVPVNPHTGWQIDITNGANWHDFDTVYNAVQNGRVSGAGFSLTKFDPYGAMDLDRSNDPDTCALQAKIYEGIKSYSEISPGGGLHIWGKFQIAQGRKRGAIEMYSSVRFMTITGNVYRDLPINSIQAEADDLWEFLSRHRNDTTGTSFESQPQTEDDNKILDKGASLSLVGDKFTDLYFGRWQQYYETQSEADFAFIDICACLTNNKEQLLRLFMNSGLGQRDKARMRVSDYVMPMVHRAYDRTLTPLTWGGKNPVGVISANGTSLHIEETPREDTSDASTQAQPPSDVKFPPGLLGEIAQFILDRSMRPVPEVALAGALALMAGICGRQYNTPTHAGLNLYVVLLASTGIGKESMRTGINDLMKACELQCPSMRHFLGPGSISSGPALIKELNKRPCMLGQFAEFGQTMTALCHPSAAPHMVTYRQALLDAYTKSGRGNILPSMVYSDRDKNVGDVYEPAFSFLAESVPSKFYENISEEMTAQGLVARFLVIEYLGDRPDEIENPKTVPDPGLIIALTKLAVTVTAWTVNKQVCDVMWSDNSKLKARRFNKWCDQKIRSFKSEALRDLYSRAHLTAIKIASLVSIGNSAYQNFLNPTISGDDWDWAEALVKRSVSQLEKRFEKGDVGKQGPEAEQLRLIREFCGRYINQILIPKKIVPSYAVTENMVRDGIIPFKYLSDNLAKKTAFNQAGFGIKGAGAVKNACKLACDEGLLSEIPSTKRIAMYGSDRLMFSIREDATHAGERT